MLTKSYKLPEWLHKVESKCSNKMSFLNIFIYLQVQVKIPELDSQFLFKSFFPHYFPWGIPNVSLFEYTSKPKLLSHKDFIFPYSNICLFTNTA